jgi:hypothetical protein
MEVSVYVSGGVRIDVGKMGREGGRKKVHEVEEAAGDDNSVHIGEILWDLHSLMGWFVGNLDVMGVL